MQEVLTFIEGLKCSNLCLSVLHVLIYLILIILSGSIIVQIYDTKTKAQRLNQPAQSKAQLGFQT